MSLVIPREDSDCDYFSRETGAKETRVQANEYGEKKAIEPRAERHNSFHGRRTMSAAA